MMVSGNLSAAHDDIAVPPSVCSSKVSSLLSERNALKDVPRIPNRIMGFPSVSMVQGRSGNANAYTHSLLLKGHGFPFWLPRGAFPSSPDHIKRGMQIGDVGIINEQGAFQFFFNMFLPREHPCHEKIRIPREFQPTDPPHPSEIRSQPNYFPPGTIITSDGIQVVKDRSDPLNEITFKSKAREGGILILRDGASREDLVCTDKLHEYVHRHARHWYQHINNYAASVVHPNGALVVVTGCDKAKDWANAAFCNVSSSGLVDEVELQYSWLPNFKRPWLCDHVVGCNWYKPSQTFTKVYMSPDDPTKSQCIFARTLRVSLSTDCWLYTMPYVPYRSSFVSFINERRSLIRRLVDLTVHRLKLVHSEADIVSNLAECRTMQLFQPNIMLAQILLTQHPFAQICLIEDSCWFLLARGGPATKANLLILIHRVLMSHTAIDNKGCLTLSPRAATCSAGDIGSVIPRLKLWVRCKDRPTIPMWYAGSERVGK